MSECHKIAIDYETNLSRTWGNVWEMSSDAAKKAMESNRTCFIKVTECLQYLARQGQAMQGDTDDESNSIQLLKLRGKDQPLLLKCSLTSIKRPPSIKRPLCKAPIYLSVICCT